MHPYGGAIPLSAPYTGYWITPGIVGVDGPRVFSYKLAGSHGDNRKYRWHELINRNTRNPGKYPMIFLSGVNPNSIDKRMIKMVSVQSLVCLAMIGPCPPGLEIRHIDQRPEYKRDPSFYYPDGRPRLEYATFEQNMRDLVLSEGGRTYSRAVRVQAMLDIKAGMGVLTVARKVGCTVNTVRCWRRQFYAGR